MGLALDGAVTSYSLKPENSVVEEDVAASDANCALPELGLPLIEAKDETFKGADMGDLRSAFALLLPLPVALAGVIDKAPRLGRTAV